MKIRLFNSALLLAVIAMINLAIAPLSHAITFGEPDEYEYYPNVGAMILQFNGEFHVFCSGTLIAPDVFLTAAHCTETAQSLGIPQDEAWVTFDAVFDEDSTMHRGTYSLNPNYGHDMHDRQDVAVVILDEPIYDIVPAELPPQGYLSDMKENKELKDQQLVTVGYGLVRNDKTKSWKSIIGGWPIANYSQRRFVEQTYLALAPYWLTLSKNPATGSGGGCYGDSGGPHFLLSNSNMVVSLTVTGDHWCRATEMTYRLDTDSARSYLADFVYLP